MCIRDRHVKTSYPSLKVDSGGHASDAYVRIISGNAQNSRVDFGDTDDDNIGIINYDHGTNAFQIRTNGASNSVVITNEGEMQLSGNANPVLSVNRGGSNTTNINIKYNGSTRAQLSAASNGFEISAVGSTAPIQFFTNGEEQMRLHSTGALSVGTSPSATYWSGATAAFFETTVQNTVTISHSGGGNNYPLTVRNNRVNSSTEGFMITFLGSSAVLQGSIRSINGSTSYNSGSDYRLKENIVDISDGITRVKQLQPRRFNWISDSNKTVQDGFIAHELQSVVPESTTGTKDEIVNQEGLNDGSYHPDAKVGDAVYQSVDYGKMTPLLTAALKELIAKVETLESKVAALEGS